MALQAGAKLGPYEILSPLGAGDVRLCLETLSSEQFQIALDDGHFHHPREILRCLLVA
jgi:hypothetical protein